MDETEGLLLTDLQAISQLARNETLAFDRIPDAVRHYKVGVTDDPSRKIDRQKIRNYGDYIRTRVKGQDHAVVHTLDIIERTIAVWPDGREASRGPPSLRDQRGSGRPNSPKRSPACCSGTSPLTSVRHVGVFRRACGPTSDRSPLAIWDMTSEAN